MNKLEAIYPNAIEHTKHKIEEDIDAYLEEKKEGPSFEQYLHDRTHYLEQIWLNIWLNKVTNDVPKKEKKVYLSEKGYEVEGVDRKLINHLFRTEMRTYKPFNVFRWLENSFTNEKSTWHSKYKEAREIYRKRQEQQLAADKRQEIKLKIFQSAKQIIVKNQDLYYLHVRYFVAKQLAEDLIHQKKYYPVETYRLEEKLQEIGSFQAGDYTILADFFDELTGSVHKTFHWEYQTYYYVYERLIEDYMIELILEELQSSSYSDVICQYEDEFSTKLSSHTLKELLAHTFYEVQMDFFASIQDEYVSDLLALVDVPFEEAVHQRILEADRQRRKERKLQAEREIARLKEQEERMIDDIFGREYSPSAGRNIQYILHIGETNTGKTYHALERMKQASSGLYLAPLRLLALEVYDKLNREGVPCNLKTGEEEKEVEGANHISCTVEMFHEKEFYECIVIDESQMIADKDRGFSWYKAITKSNAKEVHIIGSRNAELMVVDLLGDSDIKINRYSRDIPLEVEGNEFSMKDTKKGDALVCFSRRRVLETAARLQQNNHSVSMIYGSMPPETRKKQMQRFLDGETSVIVATDAIGMGLNLPIRRIVFLETEKFDGTRRRRLTSQEVKQIAGRAGRKGIYNIGKVAFTKDIKMMKRLLMQEDESIANFAIAPTNAVLERFQKYHRDLGTFFALWQQFDSPHGTKKATLTDERELYALIKGTEIEARLSMMDLYGFLHLPFSTREPALIAQWKDTIYAIVRGNTLPEPKIIQETLEDLELSYKAIGLHLLFLYRLGRQTEAYYWERVRHELSDEVHERLKTDVRHLTKACKQCGRKLNVEHRFAICDACHFKRSKKKVYHHYDD